ncbi:uncharacterized protein [Coffea arabica]|uniref:Uncharacterized protein n=1 Tax=Coffea arabica TaxID=13443 RepID=A0A6P6TGM6_COFAR|nr:pentatricopeptide repeat-containing protein At3g22470, mitochondrial-like [Coffea arabica]
MLPNGGVADVQFKRRVPYLKVKPVHTTGTADPCFYQGLYGAGRYLSAKEVFGEIQAASLKPSFHTYYVELDGLCKTGHVNKALQLFLQWKLKE